MRIITASVLACFLLVLPVQSWAAWSFVSGASSGTGSLAITKSVTTGNVVVVAHAMSNATDNPTISDDAGNVWTPVSASPVHDATNSAGVAMWYAVAKSTASITVTIANSSTTFSCQGLAEYSGNSNGTRADGSTGTGNIAGTTSTDGQATGSFTTAIDGDLIVSFIVDVGGSRTTLLYTAGTGYTARATASQDPGGAAKATCSLEDKVQSSHGSINPTWTEANSFASDGISAAFQINGIGGVSSLMLMGVGQ